LSACVQQRVNESDRNSDSIAAVDLQYQARRDARIKDSTASVRFSSGLVAFYNSLTNKKNIIVDTSWYQNLDKDFPIEDQDIARPRYGDNPLDFASFPFTDIKMTYNAGAERDYFLVNGWKIPETVYTSDNRFLSPTSTDSATGGGIIWFSPEGFKISTGTEEESILIISSTSPPNVRLQTCTKTSGGLLNRHCCMAR
jgi:hypothetical protein